jgi:TctA family transporter
VPLLTLGLPTTATAAIMLAGFQQFGCSPGPLLFITKRAGLGPDRQPAHRKSCCWC